MKNIRFLSLSLMIAILLLTACSGGASTTAAPQPTKAAEPTQKSEPTKPAVLDIDPANETGEKAKAAAAYLYEGLIIVKDGVPAGVLAETYTVSDDGLDYIFNLRPGVTFHDGSALNADLVIANFNRWFDPKDANRGSGDFAVWAKSFGGFKGEVAADGKPKCVFDGIEKVNDLTVLVHLNTPDEAFLTKLSDPAFSIVSPKAFSGGDGGSGPYQLTSLSGSTANLDPFALYWNASAVPSKAIQAPVK